MASAGSANQTGETQNEPRQLQRLAAQRHLYQKAKSIVFFQALLAVPFPLAWSAAVAGAPWLAVYAGLWGLCASLADALILDPFQRSLKRQAARIQELFDCDVLQLEWNGLVAESRVDPEAIARAAEKYRPQNKAPLADWYPPQVRRVPLHLARLICQRSNLWWEADLHRTYTRWLVGVVVGLVLLIVLIGLIGELTLPKFVLAVLAPVSPALLLGTREYRSHCDVIAAVGRFKAHLQEVWDRALKRTLGSEEAARESRKLQDVIFQHRAKAPLIFDWIYRLLRRRRQAEMERATEELIREAAAATEKGN